MAAALAVGVYTFISGMPRQPENLLDEVVEAHPQMAASFASGDLPLLADTNKALAEAEKVLSGGVSATRKTDVQQKPAHPPVRSNAWRHASTQAASPSIPVAQGISVYQQVDVDMEAPVFPSAGEQVSLALPGNLDVLVNVESGVTNPNGDYTWRGHVQGHGTDYPVVMTYGGASVFATITTPEGSYTMESINGSGWVYKNPSEFELSNAGVNDYLEIPLTHDMHE